MAVIKVTASETSFTEPAAVAEFLARYQIEYEQWTPDRLLPADSTAEEVLAAYAGEVDALGPDASLWTIEQRVMGIVGGGGHAEFVIAHEREIMPVPAELTFEEAAAIPEAFLTAYDAIVTQLRMNAGESLLIHAVGSGVGTAAVQIASAAGVGTIGTSRSGRKLESARGLGLISAVDSTRSDWPERVIEMSGGAGVNGVLDLVGAGYLAGNLAALAYRGRMVVVGLTAGARAEIDLGTLMRKRIVMMGTVLRARPLEERVSLAREFAARMLPLFSARKLRPVVDSVHSFDQIREAHDLMESNTTFGKVILRWDPLP